MLTDAVGVDCTGTGEGVNCTGAGGAGDAGDACSDLYISLCPMLLPPCT